MIRGGLVTTTTAATTKPHNMNQFKKIGNLQKGNQNSNAGPGIFLPRTGIEQPFMKDRPRFKETHKEFEPTHTMNVRTDINENLNLNLELSHRGICQIR
jgi:hypothetical protein